ncbi:MAG TPA: hypothetical protein VFR50_09475 [Casimicrobiaceae bacterium]|nr:hypothetical protein [Casimicrobiaceae bacterium]
MKRGTKLVRALSGIEQSLSPTKWGDLHAGIDVTLVDENDANFNPLGVRGTGEIGITGVAAAIANAVFNATGKRVRSLPITPDKLL